MLDIVRNLTLDHLRLNPEGIRARVQELLVRDNRKSRAVARSVFTALCLGALFYMMQYVLHAPKLERQPVPTIMQQTVPLEQFTYHYSTPLRHLTNELRSHGYPNRAIETGYIYTVGTWLTLIFTCMVAFGFCQEFAYGHIFMVKKLPERRAIRDEIEIGMIINCFPLVPMFFIINYGENIDWVDQDKTLGVHYHYTNNYLMVSWLILSSITVSGYYMYLNCILRNFTTFITTLNFIRLNSDTRNLQ